MRVSLGLLAALFVFGATPGVPTPVFAQEFPDDVFDGVDFRTIGPANMSGRIVDLAVYEADPRVFWAASATGGVWKTVNNGITWTPVFQHEGTHSVGDIAVHQADTSIVWVGTGERANRQSNSWGDGVYRSIDGGETWEHMGLEESHHVGRIVIHPDDPDVVFVAAMGHLWGPNEERGLYRTTDGGETWERVIAVDENTGAVDVAMDPNDPSIMYAATYQRRRQPHGFHGGGPGSALWKSTDGGETWEKLGPSVTGVPDEVAAFEGEGPPPTVHDDRGLPMGDWGRVGISIHRADPRIVYVSIEQGWRFNASTRYVERRAGTYRSTDRGETWEWMSDVNPRPMYASQPVVDPNDPDRIYHMNFFTVSTDGGRTFESLRQSLHGDDRFLWIDPADSRHLIKADDGGVGISYDRAETWLYVTNLPVSQFYRVRVDDAHPYNVYGGLQDNGSWVGPNATYRSEGVLNEDWTRLGGGDGFLATPDTTDPSTVYAESQYLGLTRLDMATGQRRDIRPGDPTGHIGPRRNFDAWFGGEEDPEFLNAMAPANWDGPYLVSPHDPAVLYAGTNELWKSTDRGASWTSLGDFTTGTERRDLEVMDQGVGELVPSIDDGIPYWPTLTVVNESPLREGVLWVGTDDGLLHVSEDGGGTWREVHDRMPGFPDGGWVSWVEPSAHEPGRVFVAVHDYRHDDYGNYVYRSDDTGRTWRRIDADLPPERVARTVREDPRNPDVLWLGTELGLFVSPDGGERWSELRGDLPTLAVNDLVVQPRENDLVLGTHGRGVWILDQINFIQEMSPTVLAADAHLFSLQPAEQIRYWSEKAHTGDMVFRGENPPRGAVIDYSLREEVDSGVIALEVYDAAREKVRTLERVPVEGGLHRVTWDLRHDPLLRRKDPGEEEGGSGPPGPLVVPGTYTVRLTVNGGAQEQRVDVREDPRLDVTPDTRRRWTATLLDLAGFYDQVTTEWNRLVPVLARVRAQREAERDTTDVEDAPAAEAAMARTDTLAAEVEEVVDLPPVPEDALAEIEETAELLGELHSRVGRLYFDVMGWTGPPTADQASRWEYYRGKLAELRPRVERVVEEHAPPER